MAFELLVNIAASITELQKNPMRVISEGAGEAMLDMIDDSHLTEVVRVRRGESTLQLDSTALSRKHNNAWNN